jgi:hypothetical protein
MAEGASKSNGRRDMPAAKNPVFVIPGREA